MRNELAKRFLNVILPPRCISCGSFIEDAGSLCTDCWSGIDFISRPFCSVCSFPFEYDMGDDAMCGQCMVSHPKYDKAKCVFVYNYKSSRLITGFKYGDKIHSTRSFARWMASAGQDFFPQTDVISPVPLHRVKLFTRRYNQSALLANKIGEIGNIMFLPDILLRTKLKPPQASLSRRRRLWNVKGVFALNKKYHEFIKGKNILLIDDVITTGATISECAGILKKAGAEKVFVIALARTIDNGL